MKRLMSCFVLALLVGLKAPSDTLAEEPLVCLRGSEFEEILILLERAVHNISVTEGERQSGGINAPARASPKSTSNPSLGSAESGDIGSEVTAPVASFTIDDA